MDPAQQLPPAVWNETEADYPAVCLHTLFEAQVARTPEAVAVVFEKESLSYRALNRRANHLALELRRRGVGPESLVSLCVERSLEMVVGLLGILKAGGAYVPLDPHYPPERLAFMLADTRPPVLLTQRHLRTKWPPHAAPVIYLDESPGEVEENPASGVTPENLAYVIYTSGSTGQPKGAMNTHRGIGNRLRWMQEMFPSTAADAVLQKTPYTFDVSVWEFFWPLISGSRLVVATPDLHGDSGYLIKTIREQQITTVHFVPSLLSVFLLDRDVNECRQLRRVICSGEALPLATQQRFFAALPEVELHNFYGPTEAAVEVTFWKCERDASDGLVPIGRPVANTQIYLLDAAMEPVPIGSDGELHIGGVQVARGYLARPELTAEKFVPNPFGEGRLYKTGDRARYRPDGAIEYLGRLDDQVKLRGFRIELGEIENVLRRAEGVREAVVVRREEVKGEPYLAGYVVAENGAVAEGELACFLRGHLPDYMVPAAWVFLEALPLNPNGKIDRRALPAPERRRKAREFLAPISPLEQTLAEAWRELLRVEQVGTLDDFFELGGHSLLAIRLVSRLREVLAMELPLQAVFEHPTLREMAAHLEEQRTTRMAEAPGPALPRRAPEAESRLSFAQQRLWFMDRLDPGKSVYNEPSGWRLTGTLDRVALENALTEIVRRHEVLRTVFHAGAEEPVAVVRPSAAVPLPLTDLSPFPLAERSTALADFLRAETLAVFDLAQGPLLRARLVRLGQDDHVLVLVLHHIVTDAWTKEILSRELSVIYAAGRRSRPAELPELPIQYADFAHWQRERMQGALLEPQFAYWRTQLAGLESLELPLDHPRPAVTAFDGARQDVRLSDTATRAVRALSQREGVSLFMTLLAAYKILLARYSGARQIAVGSVISNRNRVETEGLIGFFLNTLVLRTDLSGDPTFRELLQRERAVALGAFAHQEIPFEMLVERLQPARVANQNPLCQVAFTLLPGPEETRTAGGVTFAPLEMEEMKAKFDLNLHLVEEAGAIRGWLIYRTDLFEAATMRRMAAHFERLVEKLATEPAARVFKTEMLSAAERQQLLYAWNDTARAYPAGESIPALFAACAAAQPSAVAVEAAGQRLTYAELNARANQWARHLLTLGVTRGASIGLCLGRSRDLIVALLAILKAGGAYVPLDPAYPAERLALMLTEAEVSLVVASAETAALLPTQNLTLVDIRDAALRQHDQAEVPNSMNGDDLAYVMFTSGSTGRPKGVAITHRNVVRLVRETDYARFAADEVFLQLAPISFDASTFEIWGPLLNGGRLVVPPSAPLTLEEIGALIRRHGVTTLWLTAGLFNAMVDERLDDLRPLRQLLAGGEVLSVPHVRRALAELKTTRLINGYGPTETTTFACCHRISPDEELGDSIPIGRPIAHSTAYILDEQLQPVPIGVPGELYLGGDGVARGYVNHPELTAERFLADPFSAAPQARMYRTGDLARFGADGRIHFLGRRDQQVKIRGYRIEPGEIESALRTHPAVLDTAVVVCTELPGDQRLIAYVVPREQTTEPDLRSFLTGKLPEFMIPSALVFLEVLPLTANGKLDRAALPQAGRPELKTSMAPRTATEKTLAEIWRKVLPVAEVGVHDNFFALGGHSLAATRIISQTRAALQVELPLRALFDRPTVALLAAQIDSQRPLFPGEEIKLSDDQTSSRQLPPLRPLFRRETSPSPFSRGVWTWLAPLALTFVFDLKGQLDPAALERAFTELTDRHQLLRTTFRKEGGQQVMHLGPTKPVGISLEYFITTLTETHLADQIAEEEAATPFDLSREYPMRVRLVRLSEEVHFLIITLHHLTYDEWSLPLFFRELEILFAAFHHAKPAPRPAQPLQLSDFAHWQQDWLLARDEVYRRQLTYWREILGPGLRATDIPYRRAQSRTRTSTRSLLKNLNILSYARLLSRKKLFSRHWPAPIVEESRLPLIFSNKLTYQLKQLAARENVTLNVALLSAFIVLLRNLTHETDIALRTLSGNREQAGRQEILGYLSNILVVRVSLKDDPTFIDLLRRVSGIILGAQSNQEIPFDELAAAFRQEGRELPEFPITFQFTHPTRVALELAELETRCLAVTGRRVPYGCQLIIEDGPSQLTGWFHLNAAYDPARATVMIPQFIHLLEAVARNPRARLSLVTLSASPHAAVHERPLPHQTIAGHF